MTTEEIEVKTRRDGMIGVRMTVISEITAETIEGTPDGETRGTDGTWAGIRTEITTRTGGKGRGTEKSDRGIPLQDLGILLQDLEMLESRGLEKLL